ncbi:MAG: hypothetical protein M3Z37_05800 [Candidatus Eremiobacteraeota bacterium]|nr:hypothetical protein [Candidatus Eremiobacteraeota bacterium]
MALGSDVSAYEIPKSRGMPPVVRGLFAAGLAVIFLVGYVSVHFAHEFHVWPASKVSHTHVEGRFDASR